MTSELTTGMTAEQQWRERVRAWRASGETMAQFAAREGFAVGTLRWWSSHLGRATTPAFVRVLARPAAPARTVTAPASLVLEVGSTRIHVTRGFDPVLLADVVRALGATR